MQIPSALVAAVTWIGGCTTPADDNTDPTVPAPSPTLAPTPPAVDTSDEGTEVVDSFEVGPAKVDLLFVVDNSCSMSDEQEHLLKTAQGLLDGLAAAGLDYHIGVTTTDIDANYVGSKGKLVEVDGVIYLDVDTKLPVETFSEMASLGTSGVGSEKGLGAAYLALEEKRETTNAGFYRDDASIHTVVISDEPDVTPPLVITQTEFVEWYEALKPDPDGATFSCVCDPQLSQTYVDASATIGGLHLDSNEDADWDVLPTELPALLAGSAAPRVFGLSAMPVPDTIEVSVEGLDGVVQLLVAEVDWTYDKEANTVASLGPPLASGSVLTVTYLPLAPE